MSITGIKKRVANFYDKTGQWLGKKGFSKTAETMDYTNGTFNIDHNSSHNVTKRWYWDIQNYHYSIDNPNPIILSNIPKPLLHPEMYNVQIKTHVARDLNNVNDKGLFKLTWKTGIIGVIILVILYMVLSGQIHIFNAK